MKISEARNCFETTTRARPAAASIKRRGHVSPNPSIRGVGAPMDGLSALPWTARWCQGGLPWYLSCIDGEALKAGLAA